MRPVYRIVCTKDCCSYRSEKLRQNIKSSSRRGLGDGKVFKDTYTESDLLISGIHQTPNIEFSEMIKLT